MSKLRNIKLTIEYDGTNYCGWQIQKNARSVQGIITETLTKITGHKITLYGASRTDSGVHAKGQVANFRTNSRMTPQQFIKALNSNLPNDIAIRTAKEMPKSFNSMYGAKSKDYRYTILNSPVRSALDRNFYHFIPYQISISRMKQALKYLVGRHDFRAFATKSSAKENCTRKIYSIKITTNGDYIHIDIKGDGFLYNMVRTIAGTLLLVAQGKMKPEDIKRIIKSQERKKAGPTAPAKGLCLLRVSY
ncbi:MAG TPA: tRNA pseudouridine(38-40) synthase TruA [Planctomycetota bacterium]|nr:tRNA pseudouridine(38-40) synthase TruA [Planctomycetota bacterium]